MKTLFIVPEIRLDSTPYHFPLWAGILAVIVEQKGGQVVILDLNALRANFGGSQVPTKIIKDEISSEKWDKYCEVCTALEKLDQSISIQHNYE